MQTILHVYFPCVVLMLCSILSLNAEAKIGFSRDILPILSKKCFQCHGLDEDHRKGHLRLDDPSADDGPFTSRDGRPSIKAGHAMESELWYRITTKDEDDLMPPPESDLQALTEEEKQLIKHWIDSGANYETFWSFAAPTPGKLPVSVSPTWGRNAIDGFVMEGLSQKQLLPSSRATKRHLIRRVSLDLTGLPPTLHEIDTFLHDTSGMAYEDLVDRLLGSPRFGEHMAKYWLDLVRFADTNGLHHDHYREMTPYRDWVIRAFNENLGYDEFISSQVAGDLYPSPSLDQQIASGFNRLHLIIDVGTALPEESFTRNVVDRVTTFGTAFLGITLQCARCHDHKYDPLTMRDFYQLFAFFNNFDGTPETGGRGGLDFKRGLQAPYIEIPTPQQAAKLKRYNEEIAHLKVFLKEQDSKQLAEADVEEKKKDAEIKALKETLKQVSNSRDEMQMTVPAALVMRERSEARPAYLLKGGVYDQPGERVERDTPGFLPPMTSSPDKVKTRLDLARWLVNPSNPLTARVAVNRFWQQCFGVGLVKTSEDFGTQGELPTHPELLDYLALAFMESGWDIKGLMRHIVLSETYQQSSVTTADQRMRDPENRLLGRGPRFRMDSEMIRDQVLMVSGHLSLDMGGRSVKPPQPAKLWEIVAMPSSYPRVYEADQGKQAYRRSIYTFWKRALPPPQMSIFDAPTREACIARRERTNTPLQALLLMNEPAFFSAAVHCASRLMEDQGISEDKRIRLTYETLTSQTPNAEELILLKEALHEFRKHYRENPDAALDISSGMRWTDATLEFRVDHAAWTMLVHSLLNLDIFKTRQ
jgi:hypothetical protein